MIDLLNEFGFDGEKTPIVKGKVQTLLLDHTGFKKIFLIYTLDK